MDVPLILAVCVPGDFVNPFPPLLSITAVCGGLLSLQALALFAAARRLYPARLSARQRAIYTEVYRITVGAAIGAWGLTGWAWWQAQHFSNTCFLGPADFRAILLFATWYAVDAAVVITIPLLLVGLLLAGIIIIRRRQRMQPAY
jgi:hypothetical protein